jgi:predicted flap endonuclease-1-like 5' DNA nuclease
MKKILVRALPHTADRVAFWEKHPEHPGGEVFISFPEGEEPDVVTVALTSAVRRALGEKIELVSSIDEPELEEEAELEDIPGIGDEMLDRLRDSGIGSVAELAAINEDMIAQLAKDIKGAGKITISKWVEEARELS